MGDIVQLRALCDAADSEAFVPVSVEETSDQRTPAFVLQVNTIVQDAVQSAVTEGILNLDGLRASVSWRRIGRYVWFSEKGGVGAWIGVDFELWKRYGSTPLWLVFPSTDFGRAPETRRVLEPWAASESVISATENDYYCLGIRLLAGEEKDFVVRSVVAKLRRIEARLSELPRISSAAEPNDD